MISLRYSPLVLLLFLLSCNPEKEVADLPYFETAMRNGALANEGFRRCLNYMNSWLDHADTVSGLIPQNLYDSLEVWNAHNAAADNYPFMVLTSYLLDKDIHLGVMTDMLHSERQRTSRLNSLPDDYFLSGQDFLREEVDTGRIIFGASEYMKDGIIPLTEYMGPSPWTARMLEMLDDLSGLTRIAGRPGGIPFRSPAEDEINGELLQILSRLYWMTGNKELLDWATEIGDHYLFEDPLLNRERIRLRDHGCEIIGGLSELYLLLHFKDTERKNGYQPVLYRVMDRILEVGRNEHGMFYNEVNLRTGEILDSSIVDNWGYIYNAYYTVYLIDQKTEYRSAVLEPLDQLIQEYRNFDWENGSADGFADAIEGGINLLNREPVRELEDWINSEIKIMWSLQDSSYRESALRWKDSGIIEGWHGDGNFARTTLMYCLWKTAGLTIDPWREDVILGAVTQAGELYVYLQADSDWEGYLRFDGERHKGLLRMPLDYPRINQFPEWYTVEDGNQYLVSGGKNSWYNGLDLRSGLKITLMKNTPFYMKVSPLDP